MSIDYQVLEKAALLDLRRPVNRLRGLVQVWSMFLTAYEVGTELRAQLASMSMWAKYSMTGTMVTDYVKPWTRSSESTVAELDKSFLEPVSSSPLHKELLLFRHNVAAHNSKIGQLHGAGVIGAEATNAGANPRRFATLFVPVRVRADTAMPLGLDDAREVADIVEHISDAKLLTEQELRVAATDLRDTALRHAPVLHRLGDLLGIHVVNPDALGERQMPQHGVSPSPITPSTRTERVTIGGRKFVNVMVAWELTPSVEIEFDGNGFRIRSEPSTAHGRVQYTASFLDYQSP